MTNEREQLINDAYAAVEKHQQIVDADPYRLRYHIMSPVGLLNDPNGFIQWQGVYHLFYQWSPLKVGHGLKYWGHYTSHNLVGWKHEKIALAPSDWFDKNGCYSGSAVTDEGKLKLFYTGNVKDEQGNRETYQCLAESSDGLCFEKKGVVVELPSGYTAHFRDPKVWQHKNGLWYMVVGAQSNDLQGKAVLFTSSDLKDWELVGEVSGSNTEQLNDFGYMWECPDLFDLNGKDILIVSPQGLEQDGILYNNVYQSGYFVGKLNYKTGKLTHGDFTELDRGFEFYAPQTTIDEHGRRLMFAWMGVPEQDEDKHPTVAAGWLHTMTIPRELLLDGEKLIQKPVIELQELRHNEVSYENVSFKANRMQSLQEVEGDSLELNLFLKKIEAETFEINIRNNAKIIYNRNEELLTLERISFATRQVEARHCKLKGLQQLTLFLDTSSIEMFVNGGEEVFSARFFPDPKNTSLTFYSYRGDVIGDVQKWKLSI